MKKLLCLVVMGLFATSIYADVVIKPSHKIKGDIEIFLKSIKDEKEIIAEKRGPDAIISDKRLEGFDNTGFIVGFRDKGEDFCKVSRVEPEKFKFVFHKNQHYVIFLEFERKESDKEGPDKREFAICRWCPKE
jgi:hypothetical protein